MLDDKDFKNIAKLARKRGGYYLRCTNKDCAPKRTISIKIKKFKKIGSLIEMDFPFDIDDEKIDKITKILQRFYEDIETKGFKQKMYIGRGHVVATVYKSDDDSEEIYVIGGVLGVLSGEF